MVAISQWNSPMFTEAFLVWTAYGRDMMPRRDDTLVVSRFGIKAASVLLPAIKSLMDEFYLSNAKNVAANLAEMGKIATEAVDVWTRPDFSVLGTRWTRWTPDSCFKSA